MPSTGNIVADVAIAIAALFFTSNLIVEVFKAIYGSFSERAKRKNEERRQELITARVNQKAALHWKLTAYEVARVAVEHGVPRDELPKFSDPTTSDLTILP